MKFPDGKPKTSHTTNKVPFVLANAPKGWGLRKTGGVLGDVAPTILDAAGIAVLHAAFHRRWLPQQLRPGAQHGL